MAYVICEPCIGVKEKACVEVCPVDCIHENGSGSFPDMLFIHPDECIDCGVCTPECPVTAIFPQDDVPDEWKQYIDLNREAAVSH
jgi:NAD-dependent dihydropyrimidine dehydrogenase PreA subunit